jgi:hypothetical protein
MNETTAKKGGQAVTQLVWTITLLGLTVGIIILAIVYWTIDRIHSQRENFNAFQTNLTRMVTSLDTYLDQGRDDIRSLLNHADQQSNDGQWVSHLDDLVDRYRRLGLAGDTESREAMERLDRQLSELKELRRECLDWNLEADQVHSAFPRARLKVDSSLSEMRTEIIGLEGRQRLQRAIQIRQYRLAGGSRDHQLTHQIIGDLSRGSEITTIKTELADLTLLNERLVSEDQIDNLVDLKDNQIKATLDRLHHVLKPLAERNAMTPALGPDFLKDLEIHLFGQGFRIDDVHQTIIPGQGGLYLLCRSRLSLAARREALQERVNQLLADLSTTREQLGRTVESIANKTAQGAELALKKSWKTMLTVLLVTFWVFLILSLKITQNVRRQIKAIEKTNENLTTEICERQKMEAALRQSEEALRASKDELETRVEERTSEMIEANHLLAKEVAERKHAEEKLRNRGEELSKALRAASRSRQVAEAERDKSRHMLAEVTESKRRLEILISDATAREMVMVGLKREVNGLLAELNREIKYLAPQKVDQIRSSPGSKTTGDLFMGPKIAST